MDKIELKICDVYKTTQNIQSTRFAESYNIKKKYNGSDSSDFLIENLRFWSSETKSFTNSFLSFRNRDFSETF